MPCWLADDIAHNVTLAILPLARCHRFFRASWYYAIAMSLHYWLILAIDSSPGCHIRFRHSPRAAATLRSWLLASRRFSPRSPCHYAAFTAYAIDDVFAAHAIWAATPLLLRVTLIDAYCRLRCCWYWPFFAASLFSHYCLAGYCIGMLWLPLRFRIFSASMLPWYAMLLMLRQLRW